MILSTIPALFQVNWKMVSNFFGVSQNNFISGTDVDSFDKYVFVLGNLLCINTRYTADNNIRVVNDNENGNDNYSNCIQLCFNFLFLEDSSWCRKNIFTIGQHHIIFEIRFQKINTKSRILCTRRNRNFWSENLCVNDGIICIYKLNTGAN